MKKTFVALVATIALSIGVLAAPASAAPSPNGCHGQFVVGLIQGFGNARAAADAFIGEFPQAVRIGQNLIQGQCRFLRAATGSQTGR